MGNVPVGRVTPGVTTLDLGDDGGVVFGLPLSVTVNVTNPVLPPPLPVSGLVTDEGIGTKVDLRMLLLPRVVVMAPVS